MNNVYISPTKLVGIGDYIWFNWLGEPTFAQIKSVASPVDLNLYMFNYFGEKWYNSCLIHDVIRAATDEEIKWWKERIVLHKLER